MSQQSPGQPYPQHHSNQTDSADDSLALKTRLRLYTGFTALLILFVFPIVFGLNLLHKAENNIATIVDEHNVKTELVSGMVNAARARSLLLYHMVSTTDPFERDELFTKIRSYGASFANARLQVQKMQLTPEEADIIKEQGRLSGIAVPLQRTIIDLAIEEQLEQATQLLINQAVPAQNNVMQELQKLQELQHQAARSIAQENQRQLQDAYSIIVVLACLALITGILIAAYVTRYSARTERRLYLEKELAQVTLHSIADAIITTDEHGKVTHMNANAEKLTGWPQSKATGKEITRVFNVVDNQKNGRAVNPITTTLTQGKVAYNHNQSALINSIGDEYAIEYSSSPIRDQKNKLHGAIIVFRDVTEIRSLTQQLTYQATHDSLTGLINRREFERRLNQALSNARAEHQQHVLLYMDLDLFKVINDTCGHAAGDELLKQLSDRLRHSLRESDILARLGGDEFGMLLESCPIDKAIQIAEDIRAQVHETRFIWDDKSFEIGASIGLVPITATSGTLSDILSEADTACYEAKDQGRNRIHLFHPDDSNLQKRRGDMQWVHRINDAIDQDRFVLYCHKIENITPTNTACKGTKAEILVRLKGEHGEIIPPMAFIPAAERYNMMPILDQIIINKAFAFLQENQDADPLCLFINLSGQSICDPGFLDFIINELDTTAIDATNIVFEITETAAIANFSRALHFINKLKELGCRFALDDFGSGLSSFSYLKNMPVDFLKIDGTFVRGIDSNEADAAFIEAIHNVSKTMNIDTVAEHVETGETLILLERFGINFAQGYHFDEPQPLETILQSDKD